MADINQNPGQTMRDKIGAQLRAHDKIGAYIKAPEREIKNFDGYLIEIGSLVSGETI